MWPILLCSVLAAYVVIERIDEWLLVTLGLVDEDEEIREVADRAYWEKRGTKETVKMADAMLGARNAAQ